MKLNYHLSCISSYKLNILPTLNENHTSWISYTFQAFTTRNSISQVSMDNFKCIEAYENHYEGHIESSELYRGP